jgi:hypothetical protein
MGVGTNKSPELESNADMNWLKTIFCNHVNRLEQNILSALSDSLPSDARLILQQQLQSSHNGRIKKVEGEAYLNTIVDSLKYLFVPTDEPIIGANIHFSCENRQYLASVYFVGGMLYKITYSPPVTFKPSNKITITQIYLNEDCFGLGSGYEQLHNKVLQYLNQCNIHSNIVKMVPAVACQDSRWGEICKRIPTDYLQLLDLCDGLVLTFAVFLGKNEILDSTFSVSGTHYCSLCQVADYGVIAVNITDGEKKACFCALDASEVETLSESFFLSLIDVCRKLGIAHDS